MNIDLDKYCRRELLKLTTQERLAISDAEICLATGSISEKAALERRIGPYNFTALQILTLQSSIEDFEKKMQMPARSGRTFVKAVAGALIDHDFGLKQ